MNENQLKEYIKACEHMSGFFKKMLEDQSIAQAPKDETDRLKELTNLRMLARTDIWPIAVPPELICKDDEKQTHATGILKEFVTSSIQNKKFLDFGCGEGYNTIAANLLNASLSIGYDTQENSLWNEKALFTTNYKKVKENAPYDIIVLYDVLDHVDNPIEILKQIKLVKEQHFGRIFVRCHPWTSRHATHIYKDLNKAYLHLIFKDSELSSLGVVSKKTTQMTNPLIEYRSWFKEAGLMILEEKPILQPIELFFTNNPIIARRIQDYPKDSLEIQFVDFILK